MIISLALTFVLSRSMSIQTNLTVSGSMSCNSINTDSFYSNGTVHISKSIYAPDVTSNTMTVSELTVSSIYPTQSTITIDANVIITPPSAAQSFIELDWSLYSHEDFQSSIKGWNTQARSTCNSKDFFLLGFPGQEIGKNYSLPLHSLVRVTASVHMIDTWTGESLYMKINQDIVWTEVGYSGNTNICGNTSNDAAYALPIDIIYKSKSNHITVTFGSSLKANSTFGVDDVIIYLK